MRLDVYDVDDKDHLEDLSKQELIGSVEFMLHEIMRAKQQTVKLELMQKPGKKAGLATIQAEQFKERLSANIARLCIEGVGIRAAAGLFYRLLRINETSGDFVPVYQSECIKGTQGNYKWMPVKIATATLFRDDQNKLLQMELYEYSSRGDHKLLGKNQFKFATILDNYKWDDPVGTFLFKNVEVQKRPSFMDYLFGGCNISLAVAIDFTGSNGRPTDRSSLHFIDPSTVGFTSVL